MDSLSQLDLGKTTVFISPTIGGTCSDILQPIRWLREIGVPRIVPDDYRSPDLVGLRFDLPSSVETIPGDGH